MYAPIQGMLLVVAVPVGGSLLKLFCRLSVYEEPRKRVGAPWMATAPSMKATANLPDELWICMKTCAGGPIWFEPALLFRAFATANIHWSIRYYKFHIPQNL